MVNRASVKGKKISFHRYSTFIVDWGKLQTEKYAID
jgi:hypothetical protein